MDLLADVISMDAYIYIGELLTILGVLSFLGYFAVALRLFKKE